MTPKVSRRYGYMVVDWVAEYLENVGKYPVLSRVAPGEVRARLSAAPPLDGEPFESILRDVDEIIMPGITHWQSPGFFAYFPGTSSPPSLLGELLAAVPRVSGGMWGA